MTGGQPEQHRPGKVRQEIRDHRARARTAIARLITPRQLTKHHGGGAAEQTGESQLRQHAVQAIRTLCNLVDEEHMSMRGIEGEWRP